MLSCIIVDDEKNAREMLQDYLAKYCTDVKVIDVCENICEGKKAIEKHKPDCVFLDVEMPGGNGFELLRQFKEINFETIFTTAHDRYAVQAIKFSALDFLLKPVDPVELQQAVERVQNKVTGSQNQQRINLLLHNINYMNTDKKIAVATVNGFEFVSINDIIRCESDNNYTIFHFTAGQKKLMVSKTLGELEELLKEYHFFRVHQSHLINLRHVKRYVKGEGGQVNMDDDSTVDVSRRQKEEFLKQLSLRF